MHRRQSLISRALLFYGTRLPNHPRKWWLHAWLRRVLSVAPEGEIEVFRNGLKWSLDPADYSHSELFWLGTKDRWETYHLMRLVRQGQVIIDVGANFGYWAIGMASHLRGQCEVHALEPNPSNYRRLLRHIEWNGLAEVVSAHQVGLSDAAGTAEMIDQAGNSGHARIVTSDGAFRVGLTTLDDFCHAGQLHRLDVLLLDVEGFEERALRGARWVLPTLKPLIVVELWPPVMELYGSSVARVAHILEDYGYRLFVPRRSRMEPLVELPTGDRREIAFCTHRATPLVGS
jgi:FkbM family methyltransferase